MATKIKIIPGLVLVHLLTCYGSCVKNCVDEKFSFAITNRVYPDKDSIQVGDTIWIELDAPVKLLDQESNTEVDYSGAANLGSAIGFLKFGKGTAQAGNSTEAAQAFKAHLVTGEIVDNSQTPFAKRIKEFLFKEINGRYRFKVGFIALEKGDFSISPGDAAGVYRFRNKCPKAGFRITIADTDQHLYLYQQSRPGYEISSYERSHMFCVRVK
jgi:hypothetical protein